ncbi:MAG: hypothetical protein U5K79_24180 [Cyclobacteriaceae bacterium]|nr:hypothetical protein [Cyclobacteriaceae bacterium]
MANITVSTTKDEQSYIAYSSISTMASITSGNEIHIINYHPFI